MENCKRYVSLKPKTIGVAFIKSKSRELLHVLVLVFLQCITTIYRLCALCSLRIAASEII